MEPEEVSDIADGHAKEDETMEPDYGISVGETIKLDEIHLKAVFSIVERLNSTKGGMVELAYQALCLEHKLWQFINEIHPEVANFSVQFNHDDGSLTIMSRLSDREKAMREMQNEMKRRYGDL